MSEGTCFRNGHFSIHLRRLNLNFKCVYNTKHFEFSTAMSHHGLRRFIVSRALRNPFVRDHDPVVNLVRPQDGKRRIKHIKFEIDCLHMNANQAADVKRRQKMPCSLVCSRAEISSTSPNETFDVISLLQNMLKQISMSGAIRLASQSASTNKLNK